MDLPIKPSVRRIASEVRRSCGTIKIARTPSPATGDADEPCVEATTRAASGTRLCCGVGLSIIVRRTNYHTSERGASADSVVERPYDKPVTRGRNGTAARIKIERIDQKLGVRLVTPVHNVSRLDVVL